MQAGDLSLRISRFPVWEHVPICTNRMTRFYLQAGFIEPNEVQLDDLAGGGEKFPIPE